jgi:hypothetical protein
MALSARATQEFVPIEEVRDGIIMLKDGSMRALLLASSVNLSLKSSDEQMGVLSQFQNFLNSLDFSVQIVVQSRRLDIRPYLSLLDSRMKQQLEPLMKVQTREYINFIREFTDQVAIMSKTFLIVVPYSHGGTDGAVGKIFGGAKREKKPGETDAMAAFEEKRTQLEQRIGVIQQGLSRVGVKTVQLGTEESIELFYKVFNPGEIATGIVRGAADAQKK